MRLPLTKVRKLLPSVLISVILLAVSGVAYGVAVPNAATPSSVVPQELPLIGTYENLLNLLESSQEAGVLYRGMGVSKAAAELGTPQTADMASGVAPSYSETNVQVQGVDEADLVKTDGSYIYKVNKNKVLIISALPANEMELASTISFDRASFVPVDLYLDTDKLVVIGTYTQESSKSPHRSFQSTQAIIYDISDKNRPVKVRELEMEGSYLSSRKVNSSFYLLTNKYLDYDYIKQGEGFTPLWRDSAQGAEFKTEQLSNIRYFPDCISPNYFMVATLNLESPQAPADMQVFLGSGDMVYASQQNLYVAVQNRGNYVRPLESKAIIDQPSVTNTKVYKFALQADQVQYSGSGSVPGTILNQFSMDEYNGYFRIATTSGQVWRNDQHTSKNNVYILDQDLEISGKIEDIAPGERIYSTRFIGDRAYMVTFRQVDPFFVLDLKDPQNPTILGKLKIPGYSDYLHPYDENHIIGFGKDTVETKGWDGQSQAFYQGMKIAIFDVTDVSNPVQTSQVSIGDRGTDSELLRNHKALLFNLEKNILAFPVTVRELPNNIKPGELGKSIPDYGQFSFQGLYVYHIDLDHGLQFVGRISHLSSEDTLKAGDYWYNQDKNIERALLIGDNLYTLSSAMIKAHSLPNLIDIRTLIFP